MMVTIFRFNILPGREGEFRSAWESVTQALLEAGSHGSALFRDEDGIFHAIARWPDTATRDAAFAANHAEDAFEQMALCLAGPTERKDLFEESNLWTEYSPS